MTKNKITKNEIKSLFENGKLKSLMSNIIYDGTKQDANDALYLLFKKGSDEYNVTFESLPYSRGGRYAKHTSTLHSTQSWEIKEYDGCYYVSVNSTSKSANCPSVIVPNFYTEKGKNYFNNKIQSNIDSLQKQLLK